jgi:hypothetical protein
MARPVMDKVLHGLLIHQIMTRMDASTACADVSRNGQVARFNCLIWIAADESNQW